MKGIHGVNPLKRAHLLKTDATVVRPGFGYDYVVFEFSVVYFGLINSGNARRVQIKSPAPIEPHTHRGIDGSNSVARTTRPTHTQEMCYGLRVIRLLMKGRKWFLYRICNSSNCQSFPVILLRHRREPQTHIHEATKSSSASHIA
jgi:hypothetical protein